MTQIITRAEARAQGFKRYFTGKPCKHGHVAERWVGSCVCTICDSGRQGERRSDPEYAASASKKTSRWARENPASKKRQDKAYRTRNREKVREYLQKWRAENADLIKENQTQYRKENLAKAAERAATYRAKIASATPDWLTAEQRFEIESLFEQREIVSEMTGVPYDVDHIAPLRGELVSGLHVPWNLQLLPSSENRSKSNKYEVA